jgi:hypothetical protein
MHNHLRTLERLETDPVAVPALPFAIERVTPNPFNPRTTIEYTVAETGRVTVRKAVLAK